MKQINYLFISIFLLLICIASANATLIQSFTTASDGDGFANVASTQGFGYIVPMLSSNCIGNISVPLKYGTGVFTTNSLSMRLTNINTSAYQDSINTINKSILTNTKQNLTFIFSPCFNVNISQSVEFIIMSSNYETNQVAITYQDGQSSPYAQYTYSVNFATRTLRSNGRATNYYMYNGTVNNTNTTNTTYSIYLIPPTPINNTNQYYSNNTLSIFFNVSPNIGNFTDYYRIIRLVYNGTPNDYTCMDSYCLNYTFYNLSVGNYSYYVKGTLSNNTPLYTETRNFNLYNLNFTQSNITSNCSIQYTKDVHDINYTAINLTWSNVTNATYYTINRTNLLVSSNLCNTTSLNCTIDTRNLNTGNNYIYVLATNGLDYSISNTFSCNLNVCVNNYVRTLQPCTNQYRLVQIYDYNNCSILYDVPITNNTYENCTTPPTNINVVSQNSFSTDLVILLVLFIFLIISTICAVSVHEYFFFLNFALVTMIGLVFAMYQYPQILLIACGILDIVFVAMGIMIHKTKS